MRRFTIALFRVFVVTALFWLVAAGAHAAHGKPLTDADRADVRGLSDFTMSVLKSIITPAQIASSDPAKACETARMAEQQARDLQARTGALHDRLAAEGKTTDGVDQMVSDSADIVRSAGLSAEGICSGVLTKSGDPLIDARIDKFTQLYSTLTTSVHAGMVADERGDRGAACGHYRVANTAHRELYDFLVDLRRQMPDNSADVGEIDEVLAQLGDLKPDLEGLLSGCPVA